MSDKFEVKEVYEYAFQVNGFKFQGYSPVLTTLGDNDHSPKIITGSFIGKAPDGTPFDVPTLTSQAVIDQRVIRSIKWQRDNGYVDKDGITPAEKLTTENYDE